MSQRPIDLEYQHSVPRVKTSGHLVAAVLIGLLTWVPIVSALATFLLARAARPQVEAGARRGSALLMAAWIIAGVNLVVAPLITYGVVTAMISARERAMMVRSMSNLRQIGIAIVIYGSSNKGWYPPDLDVATSDLPLRPAVLRSGKADPNKPAVMLAQGPCDYIYAPPAAMMRMVRNSAATPLMYEPPANYGNAMTVILFADGHVEVVKPPRMNALVATVDANRAATSKPSTPETP